MTTRRALALGGALLSMLLTAGVQAAGDPEAGRYKAQTCLGCHGVPGYTNVYPAYHVPKLGGQHAEYLVAALEAYRDDERDHPTMTAQANALSDQDMQDIAAYFASFETSQ